MHRLINLSLFVGIDIREHPFSQGLGLDALDFIIRGVNLGDIKSHNAGGQDHDHGDDHDNSDVNDAIFVIFKFFEHGVPSVFDQVFIDVSCI